jgi:hypothetical protein
MTTMHDDEIRALLAPVREDVPARSEVNEAVMRAGRPASRPRPSLRWGVTATGVAGAAAALAVVAFWPAAERSPSPREPSVAGAFMLASANAADQVDHGTYRFTRLRVTIEHPDVDMRSCKLPPSPASPEEAAAQRAVFEAEMKRCARVLGRSTSEFTTDQWVDKSLHGRVVASPFKETDANGHVTTVGKPRDEKFMFGDVLIADADGDAITDFDDLPTDPARLEPRLAELGLRGYPPSAADRARDYVVVQSAIALLTYPKVSPSLRAAAFGVLARIDGFRDLGEATDPLGRHGRQVEITGPAQGLRNGEERVTISLLFDADRAELLSWVQTTEHPTGKQVRTSVLEAAGDVEDTNTRP